jgi:BNR/Asp-box repeat
MRIQFFIFFCCTQLLTSCQFEEVATNLAFPNQELTQQIASTKPIQIAQNLVFKSLDGGQTWQDVSVGLPVGLGVNGLFARGDEVFLGAEKALFHANSASIKPFWEKDYFFNEKFSSIFSGKDGIYISDYGTGFFQKIDGMGIWSPKYENLTDKKVISIFESNNKSLFVGSDTGIFKSLDNGKLWKQVFSESSGICFVATDDALVAGVFYGIIRSTDGGEHWDWTLKNDGATNQIKPIKGGLAALFMSSHRWVGDDKPTRINWLYFSDDNGKNWQSIDANLPFKKAIFDIEQLGDFLYCSCDTGIFRSADLGKTWQSMSIPVENKFFNLTISGQAIYAVFGGGGC